MVWVQCLRTVGGVSPERGQEVPFELLEMRTDRETLHFVAA